MDDNDAFLMQQQAALCANRHYSGCSKGQPNFKIDEDLKLASAYAGVSTNAAVVNEFYHEFGLFGHPDEPDGRILL